jgi:hypothetical protein
MKRELEKTLLEADLESAWLGLVQAVDRIGAAAERTRGDEREAILHVQKNLAQNEAYLERAFGLRKKGLKRGIMVAVTPMM